MISGVNFVNNVHFSWEDKKFKHLLQLFDFASI